MNSPITVLKKRSVKVESSTQESIVESGRTHLENMVKMLVEFPSDVQIFAEIGDRTILYTIDCGRRNTAQVLGLKGKNISSLRTLIAAYTARNGFRSVVETVYYPRE